MRTMCVVVLLGLCAATPCRADEVSRWLDERVKDYALARLGIDPTEVYGPELLWLADDVAAPWARFSGRLGRPRLLPPRLKLSLALAQDEPSLTLTLLFSGPRRFPVPVASRAPLPPPAPLSVDDLLASEPSIDAVQAAAAEFARCDLATLDRLERHSRAFGALPEISLGAGLDGDHDVDTDPFDNVEGAEDGRGWDLSLDLEWDLGDLVMSYERIRILSEQADRAQLRARVVDEATHLYYERQRLRVLLARESGMEDDGERIKIELDLRETTARLDAITGGEFGRMLHRRER